MVSQTVEPASPPTWKPKLPIWKHPKGLRVLTMGDRDRRIELATSGIAGIANVVDMRFDLLVKRSSDDMWEEPDITLTPGDRSEPIEREAFFAQLKAAGVQDVTVVGVAADYCVRWAVDGLIQRAFRVYVGGWCLLLVWCE